MKENKNRFLHSNAFLKFAVSYVIVILLVLLFFFIFYAVNTRNSAREETVNSQLNRLARIAQHNEEILSMMQNTADQMGVSPFVEPFVFAEHPDRAYDLIRQLSAYSVTNTFCEKMFLCFNTDDHVYSPENSMTLDMLLDMMELENMPDERLKKLLHDPGRFILLPEQTVVSPLLDGKNSPVVTAVFPFGIPDGKKGSLMFMIRKEVYLDLFSDRVAHENNTYILQNGEVVVSSHQFSVPDETVLETLKKGEEKIFWQGESWILTRVNGRFDGFSYVSLLREKDMMSDAAKSIGRILILMLGFALAAFCVAYALARHNWKPVQELSGLFSQEGPARDDWKQIRQGIDRLSASNHTLSDRLAHSLPMLRHEFVIRFLKNHFSSREETVFEARRVELEADRAYYAVVLSSNMEMNGTPLDLNDEAFRDIHGVSGCGIELIAMDVYLYLLFADREEELEKMAEAISRENREGFEQAVTAISALHSDFSQAPTAYLEAATAYENRFVMDAARLMHYRDISPSISGVMPQAERITDGISHALLLRDADMLNTNIEELLQFLKGTNMSPFAFRLIYNGVIETLLREHLEKLTRERDAHEVYDILSLTGCSSADDLSDLLRKLCGFILEETDGEKQIVKTTGTMDEVAGFIREHCTDKELSISAISETFSMPMARLSMVFKEEMKMTPLEYLTMLRVEMSRKLLDETDLPVKEIAEQVGYYDASSFIRRFRQKTGMTPLQYRRRKEEEK